jgi:formamidopyrimidine-DNA glycosylase
VGQVRVRIATDEVVADLRGPTACEVIDRDEAKAIRASLGPDPLVDGPVTGLKRFRERMMATRTPVALALMNQNVVAGIGNVYRAEILFPRILCLLTCLTRYGKTGGCCSKMALKQE